MALRQYAVSAIIVVVCCKCFYERKGIFSLNDSDSFKKLKSESGLEEELGF